MGFLLDMAFRCKKEISTIQHNQSGVRKTIEVTKKKADGAQKAIGDVKVEIVNMKSERTRLTQDIEIAKEKLADLETRDKRRGTGRMQGE